MAPGFPLHWQLVLPPIPSPGCVVQCWLNPQADDGDIQGLQTFPPGISEYDGMYRHPAEQPGAIMPATPTLRPGGDARLNVQWKEAETVIDTLSIPVVYQPQEGVPYLLQYQINAQGQGQGLTPAQAQQLTTVEMAVGTGLGGGIPDLVGQLLNVVGPRIFSQVQIIPDLEGAGSLEFAGPFPGVNAFGIVWQLVFWPIGMGLDDGNPQNLEIDYMQLTLMDERGAAGVLARDSQYVRVVNGSWVWLLQYPHRVDFYITPGCRVRAWWLLGPGQLQELAAGPPSPH